jgi:hypothetical protein
LNLKILNFIFNIYLKNEKIIKINEKIFDNLFKFLIENYFKNLKIKKLKINIKNLFKNFKNNENLINLLNKNINIDNNFNNEKYFSIFEFN